MTKNKHKKLPLKKMNMISYDTFVKDINTDKGAKELFDVLRFNLPQEFDRTKLKIN